MPCDLNRRGELEMLGDSDSHTRFADRLAGTLVARGVTSSKRVVNAIATVPRHAFFEAVYLQADSQSWSRRNLSYERESDLDLAYRDESHVVQTRGGLPSVVGTAPHVIVQMLETLDLNPGHRVLELSTGTGYSTGLVASMVEDPSLVTSVEIDRWAAQTARHNLNAVCMGDVSVIHESAVRGYPDNAPYDRVVANFSVRFVPTAWLDQLKDGGKLVTPRATTDSQHLLSLTKLGTSLQGSVAGPAAFPNEKVTERKLLPHADVTQIRSLPHDVVTKTTEAWTWSQRSAQPRGQRCSEPSAAGTGRRLRGIRAGCSMSSWPWQAVTESTPSDSWVNMNGQLAIVSPMADASTTRR